MQQPKCTESTTVALLHDQSLFTVPQFVPKPPTISKIESTKMIEELQQHFQALMSSDYLFAELISRLLSKQAKAVVFGGWIRDGLLSLREGKLIRPRDIDLVVDGIDHSELSELMPINFKPNMFNGLVAETSTMHLDIWLLRNTFLIQKLALPIEFNTLPLTTVFRINSIIFCPTPLWTVSKLIDAGCLDAISNQVLDFRTDQVPLPLVQAARAVIYGAKLNIRLHSEIRNFIQSICIDDEAICIIKKGIGQFCPNLQQEASLALLHQILSER